VAHGPRQKPLDFGGNPDLDPDLGIFITEFLPLWATAVLPTAWVCLTNSTYKRDCWELPASGYKSYGLDGDR